MTNHLSGDREQIVRSFIQDGRFTTENEVIDEALRLLKGHVIHPPDPRTRG